MNRKYKSRKKKPKNLFKLFLYRIEMLFLNLFSYFYKENRDKRKRKRKENYKRFLKNLDFKLYRFIKYFSAESKNIRKKRRNERIKRIKFRFINYISWVIYFNNTENRAIRRRNRIKAWNFFIEKNKFYFQLYIFRIYKTLADINKWIRVKENRNSFVLNTITSSILFIIAYFFTYFLYQLATAMMARVYHIPSVIYFFKTDFLIRSYSDLWTRENVILVSFIGPFISLILGFVLFRIFHFFKKRTGLLKLFFLWCTLHAFNMFFGAYIAGAITNKGFGLVVLWLFFQLFLNITFSFICIIFLIFIGNISAKSFIQTAHHSSYISEPNRTYFLMGQALLPYIIGNILIFCISLPDVKPYQAFILAMMGFMIVPIVINPNNEKFKIVKEEIAHKLSLKLIIIFVILLIIFRFGLSYGIKI